MSLNPFKKKAAEQTEAPASVESDVARVLPSGVSAGAHRVLKRFYVSEKTTRGFGMNHYTFVVANNATKTEIADHVERLYKVKVESVKVTRLPAKKRRIGRFVGETSALKKAVVVLKDGYAIAQAQP